jgi:hypothetical protein
MLAGVACCMHASVQSGEGGGAVGQAVPAVVPSAGGVQGSACVVSGVYAYWVGKPLPCACSGLQSLKACTAGQGGGGSGGSGVVWLVVCKECGGRGTHMLYKGGQPPVRCSKARKGQFEVSTRVYGNAE